MSNVEAVTEAEIELAAEAASVAAARRFVADFLRRVGEAEDEWTAVQLVSELSTNAVVHAGTPFGVRVAVSAEVLRIEVSDRNPALRAIQRHFSDDATTGRGLAMIEMLARSWGIESRAGAKTVWCELTRSTTSHPDDSPDRRRQDIASQSPAIPAPAIPATAIPATGCTTAPSAHLCAA